MAKPAVGDAKQSLQGNSETARTLQNGLQHNSKSWDEVIKPVLAQREEQERVKAEEARKEQERQEAARQAAIVSTPVPAVAAPGGTCQDWMNEAGITDQANAYIIIMRESGCNPGAYNPSSGACGIPQALPCSKMVDHSPVGQMRWMQNYVVGRYGSWAGAVAWWNSHHWY